MPSQCEVYIELLDSGAMKSSTDVEPTIERYQHSLFGLSALAIDRTEKHGRRKP